MFSIPQTFRAKDSDYVTIPVLKKFCMENKIKVAQNRVDLLNSIEEFANENFAQEKKVNYWLEEILKMGMKTCLITKLSLNETPKVDLIQDAIQKKFPACNQETICKSKSSKEIDLINYKLVSDTENKIEKGSFVFLIRLLKVKSTYSERGNQIIYPIFIDVDLQNGFIISRAKASSGLFKIGEDDALIDAKKATNAERLMRACEDIVIKFMSLEYEDEKVSKETFKKAIFNILNGFTQTPRLIQEKIDATAKDCENFISCIFEKTGIFPYKEIKQEALFDLKIFVEKYASVTYEDRSIFMKDRCAYPVKFSAHDNEFTKIQENTREGDPLQSKKAFFDSKKVVYTHKKCDKISLCYQRSSKKYYSEKEFTVSIYVDKNSCAVKFMSFVEEDDIQDVLSRVIQQFVV